MITALEASIRLAIEEGRLGYRVAVNARGCLNFDLYIRITWFISFQVPPMIQVSILPSETHPLPLGFFAGDNI
jgi:hypothetical protein